MSDPGVQVPRVPLTTKEGLFWKRFFEQPNNVMSHLDLIFRRLHIITEIDLQP